MRGVLRRASGFNITKGRPDRKAMKASARSPSKNATPLPCSRAAPRSAFRSTLADWADTPPGALVRPKDPPNTPTNSTFTARRRGLRIMGDKVTTRRVPHIAIALIIGAAIVALMLPALRWSVPGVTPADLILDWGWTFLFVLAVTLPYGLFRYWRMSKRGRVNFLPLCGCLQLRRGANWLCGRLVFDGRRR